MNVLKKRGRNLFWYSWEEVQEILEKSPAVLVTAGSFEQHGRHLPMGTDTVLTHAIAEELCEQLNLYYYPCTAYGQVWSARDFPGTVSISDEVLTAYLAQVIESIRRFCKTRILLYSFHRGNEGALKTLMRRLRDQRGWTDIYLLDHKNLEKDARQYLKTPVWNNRIWHAGELETSLMLYVAQDAVDMEKSTCEFPERPLDYDYRPVPWREFLVSGAFGDSTAASAETGCKLFALWVRLLKTAAKQIMEADETDGRHKIKE